MARGGIIKNPDGSITYIDVGVDIAPNKTGFALVNVTEAEMHAIQNPHTGLQVYVMQYTAQGALASGWGVWCYFGGQAGWQIMSTRRHAQGGGAP